MSNLTSAIYGLHLWNKPMCKIWTTNDVIKKWRHFWKILLWGNYDDVNNNLVVMFLMFVGQSFQYLIVCMLSGRKATCAEA